MFQDGVSSWKRLTRREYRAQTAIQLRSRLRLDQRIFETYLPVVEELQVSALDHRLYKRDKPLLNFWVRLPEHHDVTRLHLSFVWIRKFYTLTSGKKGRISVLRKKGDVSSVCPLSERLEELWVVCIYRYLYNKLSYARILIGSHLWSIGGQTYRWRHH